MEGGFESHRGSMDTDAKIAARDERKRPEVEKLLRQFVGDGPRGATPAYKRGHTFAFEWPEHLKNEVLSLMETHGYTFDEAFEIVESKDHDPGSEGADHE